MNNLENYLQEYFTFCQQQKRLDVKTINAYKIDLNQFSKQVYLTSVNNITQDILEFYISLLHQNYKSKTVKRKIASLKAFFHYLQYKEIIGQNLFDKIHIKFREPMILPKTIPLHTVETFLSTIYKQSTDARTAYQRRNALRDIAVIELLFSTHVAMSKKKDILTTKHPRKDFNI